MTPQDADLTRRVLVRAREVAAMVQGRTRADLSTDRMFQLAVTRLIGIVGEGTARLDLSDYRRSTEVIWPDVVRDYDTVDDDLIWDLATAEIPKVIAALERAVP